MPEKTIREVGEAFETMIAASDSVHRSATHLELAARLFRKVITPVGIGILLIVAGLVTTVKLQNDRAQAATDRINKLEGIVESLQDSSTETRDSANAARVASESAKKSLDEALAQSQRGGVSPEVITALNRINDIYAACVARGECK